jgi:hypothetical protein
MTEGPDVPEGPKVTEGEDPAPPPAPRSRRLGPWRYELRAFVELFALCGIAIVQPLLDVLSKNTGIFVTHNTSGLEAILLVVLIALVPPGVGWVVEVVVGLLYPRGRIWAHGVLVAIIVTVIAVEVVKKATSLGPTVLVVISAVIGVGAAVALLRLEPVRQFVRYIAFAVPIFALLFLGASPATDVVFASHPASTANVGFTTPHRVVLVVMDEFPEMSLLDGSGHVDSQLYPNFAAFANESTWYRNETTVAPYTEIAVPAILTGKYPYRATAVPDAADYPQNLFTLFGKAFTMNVHEAVTRLCPQKVCTSASSSSGGFGGLVSQSAELWHQFASPNRAEFSFNESNGTKSALQVAESFVRSLHTSTHPELDFVHIELPHEPWHYLPTLQDNGDTGRVAGATFLSWSSQVAADAARQQHLLQVQASDTLLGEIIAKLKAVGAFDDSMIIVTADHGVAFTKDEPLRSVSPGNYPQIMWPPLFVKYPGEKGGKIDDRPALSIDILPTIAQVVGAKVPWHVDGSSLLGPARAEGPRRIYQWGAHAFEPPNATKPPPGRQYLEFDGAKGFAAVIRGQAAPPGPDASLRIYRAEPFGDLVGRSVAPFVRNVAVRGTAALSGVFTDMKPHLHTIRWAYGEGYINGLVQPKATQSVAIALDGRVVAVATAQSIDKNGDVFFTYLIPPELVHAGNNVPTVYLIRGSPGAPSLDHVWLRS